MGWKPATMDEVKGILDAELKACNSEQTAIFRQYGVEPHFAPIVRYGITGNVAILQFSSVNLLAALEYLQRIRFHPG